MLVVFDMANMAMSTSYLGSFKTSQRSGAKECGCVDDWEEDADDNCDDDNDEVSDDGGNDDEDGCAPERG